MSEQKKKEITLADIQREVAASNQNAAAEAGESRQLIIFKLNGEEYALPIDQIKEVVLTPGIAKIPHTAPYIKGVANIRGTIITIMDLEERFNLTTNSDKDYKSFHYTLVIESESHKVGVLVKEVPNTLNVSESEIDRSSGVVQYSSLDADCIDGIVKSGNRLIVLIDFFRMMETAELAEASY
ncbi:MAG: chemotaxis protein CheW [Bacteroidota bacterium]